MPSLKHRPENIESQLGYVFKNKKLLLEALTHKSYYHENRGKSAAYNERLEFLGDSVIGLIIVEYLFLHANKFSESALAKMKSYLVSENILENISSSISLEKYLLLGKGEESTGGRKKKSILADAFEALTGAVYLDAGYEKTREIVLRLFSKKVEGTIASGELNDYKTDLQEITQLLYGTLPEYKLIKQQGEEHQRVFTIAVYLGDKKMGIASGKKKKEAEMLAAKKALAKLK